MMLAYLWADHPRKRPEVEGGKSGHGQRTPPQGRGSTRMPIANASRRGRDLWEVVNNRLVAMIRVRRAMQAD